MDEDEFHRFRTLISNVLEDKDLKESFYKNPIELLQKNDVHFADGKEVKIYENIGNDIHLVIPCTPVDPNQKIKRLPRSPTLSQIVLWITFQIQSNGPFKDRLLVSPFEVLKKERIHVPDDVNLIIHQNTDTLVNIVIPRLLGEDDPLNNLELHLIAGGLSKQLGGQTSNITNSLFIIGNNSGNISFGAVGSGGGGGGVNVQTGSIYVQGNNSGSINDVAIGSYQG